MIPPGAPRVFLVDDHHLFRAGVRSELGDAVQVVGEADEVPAAIELIAERLPDVVLLDVHLPGGGGKAVIEAIKPRHPEVRFLALSVSDAPEDVIAVIRAGARGYVTKTISGPDLVDAVRRVAAGDAVFSPRLAGFVLDAFASMPGGTDLPGSLDPELDDLTPRETRGPPSHRPRLYLQGDRSRPHHLGQDGRKPRLGGATQAAALVSPPAHPVGDGTPIDLRLTRCPVANGAAALAYGTPTMRSRVPPPAPAG